MTHVSDKETEGPGRPVTQLRSGRAGLSPAASRARTVNLALDHPLFTLEEE